MDIPPPPRRPRGEMILPMINVVFLLLIFFLMAAELRPPEPVEVERPRAAAGQPPEARPALVLARDGTVHFGAAEGEAAFAALAAAAPDRAVLQVLADGRAGADALARVMRRLAGLGLARVELTVQPRRGQPR